MATGVLLHDPHGVLRGPLDGAVESARRDDVVYVGLCLSTAAMIVAHAWLTIVALRVAPRPRG